MPVSKTEADPRVLIREGDMSSFQVIVVTLCNPDKGFSRD